MSNVFSMSDDDFEKLDLSSFEPDNSNEDEEEVAEGTQDEEENAEEVEEEEQESDETTEGEEKKDSVEEDTTSEGEINYKEVYEKLTAPFKANGKEVKIDSIDDAIQLMQMGANYSKKMTALKPNLKVLRMLEKEGVLDESKLSFLIDVSKKKPEAIAKLLKDAELDPLNVDLDTADQYQQGNYSVSDEEVAFEEVLEEIKSTPTGSKVIATIGTEWDQNSRETVVKNPEYLKVLNEHMANGVFNTTMARVDKERLLGRLSGLSDIEAYYQVGQQLNAEGAFNNLNKGNAKPPVTVKQKSNNSAVDKKKVALAKGSAPQSNVAKEDFNPLAMSDEEFEKMFKL